MEEIARAQRFTTKVRQTEGFLVIVRRQPFVLVRVKAVHAWRLFRVVRANLQIDIGIVRRAIAVDLTWKAMHRSAIVSIVH